MDKLACRYKCGKIFSSKQGKCKHEKKHCSAKISQTDEKDNILSEYKNQIYELKTKYEKDTDALKNELKTYIQKYEELYKDYTNQLKQTSIDATNTIHTVTKTIRTSVKNTEKAMSALKYIRQKIPPPALPALRKDEIIDAIESERTEKHTPCEFIIHKYKNNKLNEYLGNMISNIYKGESIEEQQIWVTDSSRFTCVISEIVDKTKAQWITDTRGIKVKNNVIKPILKIISEMLAKYIHEISLVDSYKVPNDKIYVMMDYSGNAASIVYDISQDKLINPIMKVIAGNLDFKNWKHLLDNYDQKNSKNKKHNMKKQIDINIGDILSKPVSSFFKYIKQA